MQAGGHKGSILNADKVRYPMLGKDSGLFLSPNPDSPFFPEDLEDGGREDETIHNRRRNHEK